MKVQDIMAKNVITARPEDSVTAVASLMRQGDVGCVVIANDGAVKGMLRTATLR
jgi:CBS domain-containing protein